MVKDVSHHYGGGGVTLIHPIVLVAILIVSILIFFLRRRNVIIPIIFMVVFIPMSQRIVIAGLDFMVVRILILLTLIRIIIHHENHLIKLNSIDKFFILYVFFRVICYTLQWQTMGAFINRMGFAFNALGFYFLGRYLICDFKDIGQIVKTFVVVTIMLAICMLIEQATRRNLFAIFGGVPEFTVVREGRLRSQGAFAHAILAGMFGATVMPLLLSLWWMKGRNKMIALIGIVSATIIVICSASSGPIFAYLAGITYLCLWLFRKYMRMIHLVIIFSIITLHFVMEAPVWALIDRVGVIGGSSGYHRYKLIDLFITKVDEWWLFGMKSTDNWGWMMWDTSNHYVTVGTEGGLISFILFIVIIILCFRAIGRKCNTMRRSLTAQLCLWAFCASLFSHLTGFIGVAYFDQMIAIWYLLLAMISTIGSMPANAIYPELQDCKGKYILSTLSSQRSTS